MRRAWPVILALAVALGVLSLARAAAAEIPLCVEVAAPAADLEGFRKLVRIEITRHPSHRVVEADCRSHLRIELLEAASSTGSLIA